MTSALFDGLSSRRDANEAEANKVGATAAETQLKSGSIIGVSGCSAKDLLSCSDIAAPTDVTEQQRGS